LSPEVVTEEPVEIQVSTVTQPFIYDGTGIEQTIAGLLDTGMILLGNVNSSFGSTTRLVYDILRGTGKYWPIGFGSEQTNSETVKSFNQDGFTVGTSGLDNGISGEIVGRYAGYAFRRTQDPVANASGTIASQAAIGEAYGVVSYTGDGVAGATVGHGLAVTPKMIWIKRLNASTSPVAGGPVVGDNFFMSLNGASNRQSSTLNIRSVSSSVFTLGNSLSVNGSGSRYAAYVFGEVPGISKIDTYVGNGSPEGLYVDCGFKVDFLLVKARDGGTVSDQVDWLLFDRTDLSGLRYYILRSGAPVEEPDVFYQFEGKGFRALGDDGRMFANINNLNAAYVFMAFAYIRPTVEPPTVIIDLAAELPLVN
jgi:hypothetical protein